MAATLTTAPADISLNGSDNWVELSTDLIDPDTAAFFDLDFESTGPVVGEEFSARWLGEEVTFLVAATTNATATAIPEKDGGETLAEYAQRVTEALRENGPLTDAWQVLYLGDFGGAQRVRLLYKQAEALSITTNTVNTLSNCTITLTAGTDAITEENLSGVVQVWQAGATSNDDALLVALHGVYDVATQRAAFNLLGLFPVAPVLPTASTIAAVIALTWPHGEAPGAWVKYFLRYADKYGTPAVPEALLKTASYYYAFHGAHPGNHAAPSTLGFVLPRHGYQHRVGGAWQTFRKPVVMTQPDWVYLWTTSAITACSVELEVAWTTGDIEVITNGFDTFDLDTKKMYWFSAGPRQIGLASLTPPADGAQVRFYTWRLKGTAGLGPTTIASVQYELFPCTDWESFILLDNGLGGLETVALRGKRTVRYAATRDTLRRARGIDYTPDVADYFTTNATGQQVIECNTGWYPRYYAEHLRQILLGDAWLIDTDHKRFLRVVVDTESVEVEKDDAQLHNLSFTLKAAWIDPAVNV